MSRGLGMAERAILAVLQQSGEAASLDVRRAMPDFDKSAVSRAMRSLYCKGLVQLNPQHNEGHRGWRWRDRVSRLAITEAGRAAAVKCQQ